MMSMKLTLGQTLDNCIQLITVGLIVWTLVMMTQNHFKMAELDSKIDEFRSSQSLEGGE